MLMFSAYLTGVQAAAQDLGIRQIATVVWPSWYKLRSIDGYVQVRCAYLQRCNIILVEQAGVIPQAKTRKLGYFNPSRPAPTEPIRQTLGTQEQ